jgi:hypothetical protein
LKTDLFLNQDFLKPELDIFDPKIISMGGHWSLIHELGHNMQRRCWTPNGAEEVTVNIFTLHAFDLVLHEKPWINKIIRAKLNCGKENDKILSGVATHFTFK